MLHQRVPQLLIVVEVEHLPLIAIGVVHQHPHARQDLHVTRQEIRHPHERRVEQDLHVNEQDKRLRTVSRAFLPSLRDLIQTEHRVIAAGLAEEAVVIVGAPGEVVLVAVVPEEAVAEDGKQNRFHITFTAKKIGSLPTQFHRVSDAITVFLSCLRLSFIQAACQKRSYLVQRHNYRSFFQIKPYSFLY